MIHLTQSQIDQYHRDGYLLIRNFFTPEDMENYRCAAAAYQPGVAASARIFSVPGLDHLWRDERLVAVAAQLLGGEIAFFCQADFVRYIFAEGEHIEGRHAHHDAKGTPDYLYARLHPAQTATYPVVRLGIYFQDYAGASGGLKVSPGSHLKDSATFDESELAYANVPSRPGDLVCFCARIIHSPFALRPKAAPNQVLSPWTEDREFIRDPAAFLPSPTVRETIFIDYVAVGQEADLLIKNRAIQKPDKARVLAEQAAEQRFEFWAQKLGLRLRLDFAVVETVVAVDAAAKSGAKPAELYSLLQTLKRLCLQSPAWSPHHPLFDAIPEDDSVESLLGLCIGIGERINAYRETRGTQASDLHMGALVLSGE